MRDAGSIVPSTISTSGALQQISQQPLVNIFQHSPNLYKIKIKSIAVAHIQICAKDPFKQ